MQKDKKNKTWSGRFSKSNDPFVQQFSASISFDQNLAHYDILASIAHCNMLGKIGILTTQETKQIIVSLKQIDDEIKNNQFEWKIEFEDVHMNIEQALIKKIGDTAKKLHTARSRNDQIATDLRLYLRQENYWIQNLLLDFATDLINFARKHTTTIFPGFTHLQSAQPIYFAHHLLAWFEMIYRDLERFNQMHKRINTLTLGSGALAGCPYPIDRQMMAEELKFERISQNSLDAVSDRDFCIEFLSASSILMMHFSRMCEELILWSSVAYSLVEFEDSFCTGSSIMPQKKNPDIAELVRGKTARVYGSLTALLNLMKAQPLAYNRDNQEDKEPVFDTVKTIKNCIVAMNGLITHLNINKQNCLENAQKGYSNATDLADYLVLKNIPFRQAHHLVGQCVKLAIKQNKTLEELSLKQFKNICTQIEQDVYQNLAIENNINKRNHLGGTGKKAIEYQLKQVPKRLTQFKRQLIKNQAF